MATTSRHLVTTVSPMKRGLKEQLQVVCMGQISGYNRFPDEKGTERRTKFLITGSCSIVTTVSPMKRGLKDKSGCCK